MEDVLRRAIAAQYFLSQTVFQVDSSCEGRIEVYVSAPLKVCEQRDSKGYCLRARQRLSKHFTGIDDPYEEPENPDIVIDASGATVSDSVNRIAVKLRESGYLQASRLAASLNQPLSVESTTFRCGYQHGGCVAESNRRAVFSQPDCFPECCG